MVEYIVNEIDKLTKTNNEKMKKLIELKSKSIKNSVYSNLIFLHHGRLILYINKLFLI